MLRAGESVKVQLKVQVPLPVSTSPWMDIILVTAVAHDGYGNACPLYSKMRLEIGDSPTDSGR